MILYAATVLGLVSAALSLDPDSLCDQLLTIDCSIYNSAQEKVCGTNQQEYPSFCKFSQARCLDRTIDIYRVGECGAPATTTPIVASSTMGASTTPMPTTPDPSIALFCSHKDALQCPTVIDLTCGSDKKFYRNSCQLAKAHCDDLTLVKVDNADFCRS